MMATSYPAPVAFGKYAGGRKAKESAVGSIIYYWRTARSHIYLLSVFGKNEASDLTQKEKEYLRKLVEAWNQ